MLPYCLDPFLFSTVMRCVSQKILPLILASLISLTIFGCASSRFPPNSVLKDALALQIHLAERSLENVVDLDEGFIQVVSVKPSSIENVPNQEGRFFLVKGRCDCDFPGLKDKVDSPFQLFLEQGDKGESWRLAKPIISGGLTKDWSTYPLPIKP